MNAYLVILDADGDHREVVINAQCFNSAIAAAKAGLSSEYQRIEVRSIQRIPEEEA